MPPTSSDPKFQQVVDFIRAGVTETTSQGTSGTSTTGTSTTKTSDETTTKSTVETTTEFDPSVSCPETGTMVDWKGAKNSRILFRSTTGVLMRVNFFNNAPGYDLVSDTYLGFLGFS